jgi:adenine-specific DNA-methyltransferase
MNKQEIIHKIKSIEGLSQTERAYLIELVNTKKKYGLVWEEKPEEMEELLLQNLPVLKEITEKRIFGANIETTPIVVNAHLFETEKNNQEPPYTPNHVLIEGDNLHALTALSFTHEDEIDVIYIDPPYNTGSKEDFIYNDHYVDKEDAFRHSKWLSFMSKRLNIAKRLLKSNGVIFCSIGDDEISQLTLLFNEVFTEENKLGVIARVAKTAGDMGNYFAPSKDYVLVYAKNKSVLSNFKDDVDESLFKKIETEGDKIGEKYRDDVAFYQASQKDLRPNQKYFVDCPDGSMVIPPCSIQDEIMRDGDGRWRWSKETYLLNKHLLVFKKTNKSPLLDGNGIRAKWNVYTKSYLNDRSEKGASPRDYLDQFINRKGADLIKQYDVDFSFSKPFELIQHLIKITNKSNDITVLDFFAGSGTTLHAVMNLNRMDNGKRTCIITTNNESNICEEVTYPRCLRTMKPYTNKKGKEMPFFPNNNLRYYKTEFIPSQKTESNKRLLTQASTDLLCIKEDCYNDITEANGFNKKQCSIITNDTGKYLIIVYHSRQLLQVCDQLVDYIKTLKDISDKIKLYAFSPEKETLSEDFIEVADKIDAVPLPEAIYNAYRATFRAIKLDKKQPVSKAILASEQESETPLFNQNQIEA